MINLLVPLPGRASDGSAYIDIETRKIDFGKQLPDGWVMRRRWSAFMIGVGTAEGIRIMATYDESALLLAASRVVGNRVAVYAGTREFDEMILKGRFTNARRAHSREVIYPSMPGASGLVWKNIHKQTRMAVSTLTRSVDTKSKSVNEAWCSDEDGRELVMVHNLRDVAELMYADQKCDAKTRAWIKMVMFSNAYALTAIRMARAAASLPSVMPDEVR
jgi:hypothetical protein